MYTREELEAAGLADFRVFLKLLWQHLGLKDLEGNVGPTPIQNDIADYLQHGPRRRIIMGFRGVAKTWITAAYVLWLLLLNPDLKILIVSASQPLADDTAKFIRQLIAEVPLLQHLAPRSGQMDSAVKFAVGPAKTSKDPSVKSVGITGQLPGHRADVIIADDIEIPKNSMTHLMRERLADLVKEFDAILRPGGQIIYLGTPQVEATLYLKLIRRGYDCRVWTSEVPDSTARYGGRLAPFILKLMELGAAPGTPTDPSRFPERELAERRLSYGKVHYALQFLLDPTPSEADRNPLKTRDLIVLDPDADLGHTKIVWAGDGLHTLNDLESGGLDGDTFQGPGWLSPEMQPWQGTVLAIDPSGKGRDETGYAIVRHLNGQLTCIAAGGFRDGFSEATLDAIAEQALRCRVNYWVAETNYGGGMFNKLFEARLKAVYDRLLAESKAGRGPAPAPIPAFDEEWNGWSSTQKELRILQTLRPILENHRLCIARRVLEADLRVQYETPEYSLVFQLTRLSAERGCLAHEDRLEALSMACGYFEERLGREQSRAYEDHKADLLDAELRTFFEDPLFQPGYGRMTLYSPEDAPSSSWTSRL